MPAAARDVPVEDKAAAPQPSAKAGLKATLQANRKRVLMGVAAVLLAGTAWTGFNYVTAGRFMVSTDDAYVRADATTLAAKVPGYISAIDVANNAYVHAGDVIARIDEGDYRLAVDAARDKVATQRATVDRIGRQIPAQQALVAQAQAQLLSAQAQATRAQSELDRQQKLAGNEFASRQTLEQALSNRDQANAAVQGAQAAIAAAVANVDVLKAQQQEASGLLAELQTAQAKAERDLSFTLIRAPIDGVIGNRSVQTGDYVQPGQRFASLVPLDDVYIDANFKETQLGRLRPGQPVAVSVDALPEHDIEGTVASMSPASGSTFSLLPPDNATGNFTKIVQRIPVRIKVPADVAARRLLRPGMSVVVSVNTKSGTQSAAGNDSWFAAQAAPAPSTSQASNLARR
ncbi:MAG: HlyD family secretion protein [Pseudolabrys sp.]|nr:HlyD family secretion protein [Pseudolabrys sp.]